MNELMMDVGLANEIKLAGRRAGATAEDLKVLAEGDNLAKILPVLRGFAEVTMRKLVIDGDAKPYCPENWSVESHLKMGQTEFDPSKIELWLAEGQKNGWVNGKVLRKEIEKLEGVMNANMLDGLLKNQHLIPESWKGKAVMFWGTIYRASYGNLCVRYLYWHGDAWYWSYYWLGYDFLGFNPAARARK